MVLDATWRADAWKWSDLSVGAVSAIGASAGEALACRQAFGDYGRDAANVQPLLDGITNRGEMMQFAACKGDVRWLFRPLKRGLSQALDDPYETLDADRGRQAPYPAPPRPRCPDGRGRTVYRLGRIVRILLRR